jgi:membrane-associated phospholipid phosphatase
MLFELLDRIGYNGPLIMGFINIFSMWKQHRYLSFYIIFYFIDSYINKWIKLVIKQPRPNGYYKNKYEDGGEYVDEHIYGMPSAHSERVFYSLIYLWLVIESKIMFIIGLFICILTVYQRWKYKKHTVEQLSVGAVVGTILAHFVYYLCKNIY